MTEDKKIIYNWFYKSESEEVPDGLFFSYHFSHNNNNNNNNNNNKSNILITDAVHSTLKEDEKAGLVSFRGLMKSSDGLPITFIYRSCPPTPLLWP